MKENNQDILVSNLFDQKSSAWDAKYEHALQSRLRSFKDLLVKYGEKDKPLLDVGCGTGNFCEMAFHEGFKVEGLDLSPQMINACKSRFKNINNEATFYTGSIFDISLTNGRYGSIICSSVLEYTSYPEEFLEILYSLLAPKGILLISVPNQLSRVRKLEHILKNVTPLLRFMSFIPKVNSYLTYLNVSQNRYSPADFKSVASDIGFEISEWVFQNPVNQNNKVASSSMLLFVLRKPDS